MCLCICGPQIFGIAPSDAAHLSDTFDGLSLPVIMSNLNKFGSFTLGGDLPHLATPNTRIFIFISFKTVRHILDVVPCYRAPPLNTKHSVDQPCTYDILSNTKHGVDLYHALTLMSCDDLVHNAMQSCHCLSKTCYMYNKCYMCI